MASEVLKVSHTAGVTNSESVLINGVSGHTYTILSITFCGITVIPRDGPKGRDILNIDSVIICLFIF